MHHGVNDRLTYCCGRQRPSVRVTHTADLYAMQVVLPHEAYCLVNRARQWTTDLQSVDQMHLVETVKATSLYPGVWETLFAITPEEQHASDGRNPPPLMLCHDAQSVQVRPLELAHRSERL